MTMRWSEEGGVVWALFDRPSALNAIDFSTMGALEELVAELEASETAKVLVLTGAGRAFVSGGDLKEFAALTTAAEAGEMATRMSGILERLEALPIWTVAGINGDAYGGGCELALACDFRVLARGARLGFTQVRFALTPGWGGLTRLVERVGRGRGTLWLATGARVGAEEAEEAGLVEVVLSPEGFDEGLKDFAARLAGAPRSVIGALKAGAWRAVALPREDALAAELGPFCELWVDEEHVEAVEAFLGREQG